MIEKYTPFNSSHAVRLAKFAIPEQAADIHPMPGIWGEDQPAAALWKCEHFTPLRLDDVALAEKRVLDAGLGYELYKCLLAVTGNTHGKHYDHTYATAEQRAVALLLFLDTHPNMG